MCGVRVTFTGSARLRGTCWLNAARDETRSKLIPEISQAVELDGWFQSQEAGYLPPLCMTCLKEYSTGWGKRRDQSSAKGGLNFIEIADIRIKSDLLDKIENNSTITVRTKQFDDFWQTKQDLFFITPK